MCLAHTAITKLIVLDFYVQEFYFKFLTSVLINVIYCPYLCDKITRKLLHVENILGAKDKNARRIQIF